ncbi:YchJ family protein [Pseudoalteromonas sp. SCSIO 43210]
MTSLNKTLCLCGSQQNYVDCCEPFHLAIQHPQTPELLMRSRYSAYALKNAKYIYQTYTTDKQPENPVKEIKEFADGCRFIKLTIIDSGHDDSQGFVEFKAHYFYDNLYCELHEQSKFIKEKKQWKYSDGVILPVADIKIGRNDDCPCGSTKKYKKCHSL